MELEASYDEDDLLDEDDMMTLGDSSLVRESVEKHESHEEVAKKTQKRKTGWGLLKEFQDQEGNLMMEEL
jgi:hypothetical protein